MTDTDVANSKIVMPPLEDLAVQTIHRLSADGYTSSLMKLPKPLLNELGRLLAAPGADRPAILEWLNAKPEGGLVKRTSFYRFDQRFREVLKQTIAEWGSKLMLAELSSQPDFQVDELQRVIKNRVHMLVAQEVMTTTSPDDFDTSRLNAVLSMMMAADKGELEREKLVLAQGQAEHRAAPRGRGRGALRRREVPLAGLGLGHDQGREGARIRGLVDDAQVAGQRVVEGDGHRQPDDGVEVRAGLGRPLEVAVDDELGADEELDRERPGVGVVAGDNTANQRGPWRSASGGMWPAATSVTARRACTRP